MEAYSRTMFHSFSLNHSSFYSFLSSSISRAAAEARWEKRVRSKRLRREASVSPLIVEEDTFDESKKGEP